MPHAPVTAGEKPEIPTPVPSRRGKNKLTWIISAIMAVAVVLGGLLYFVPSNKDVAVPELIGISLDEAAARLERERLRPGMVRHMPSERPTGTVIEQDPPPGSQLPPEPETVMVRIPDVSGREVKEAVSMLKDAGLNVEPRMEREETSRVEAGTVLKQSLRPGSRVRPDEAITLVFAVLPRDREAAGEIVLPDFTGWPVLRVEAFLKDRGLVLGPVHEKASSEQPAGTVIGQHPPAKTRMEKGGAVLLLVAVSAGEGAVLPAPEQMWPEDGRSFDNYPRTTALRWKEVSGAASYTVELDCLNCCESGKWCSELGRPWKVACGISAARSRGYKFEFAGAQPGRWRVWAVDKDEREGEKSPWRTFRYTR
ncbi:MAG: PASTA domain-containing protein [Sulfurimicrobium sp.]|nr:PASTA domain-containing protein [Sulfurimicrobium sp.]